MSAERKDDPGKTLYVIIAGAGTARRMPAIIERLTAHFEQIFVVPTENAARVISRRELALIEGVSVIDSYFDEDILPYPPFGTVLVAPCTFNSLNKLAAGIADTLALSIAAEAIGRGTPVFVALSVNPPLHAHPRTGASVEILRAWGVKVLDPDTSNGWTTLAVDDEIVAAVSARRESAERA
jgi:phosphopantothenoylcysteine synthetase/decarboxylase